MIRAVLIGVNDSRIYMYRRGQGKMVVVTKEQQMNLQVPYLQVSVC